jgi:hypothetical protein
MAKSKSKTKPTAVSPAAFVAAKSKDPQQAADARSLMRLFKAVTGKPPKMWGPTIVGFGSYHYVYPTGREGDAPLLGFALRGSEIVLYVLAGAEAKALLKKLGKHKSSVACVYIKRLEDVDLDVLEQIAKSSIAETRRQYPAPA